MCGFVFGVGGFGLLLSWVARFGTGAFVSLVLLLAGFAVVFSLIARLVLRSPSRILRIGGVAAAWTLVEQWRGAWPLGGFTWGSLGISQVENPLILPLARISGSVGITLAVAAVNMLVLEFLIDRQRSWQRYALLLSAGLVVVAPVTVPLAEPRGGPLQIVSLQVDVRRASSVSPAAEDREVAQLHVERHRRLVEGPGADLAVWGEGSLDPEASADPITMSAVTDVIREVGIPTIVGAAPTDAEGQRTSALAFDGAGRLVDRYDKSHLVPFGEYVPWRSQLSWFEALDQIPVDRVAGDGAEPLVSTSLPAIGTPICFENAFPGLVREMVRNGAQLLVVPVNNASYGFTAASEQHLQMSRMRAVETDRWVVNAGVSGITAAVDPTGQVSARTELFEDATLRATVFTNDARTPFVRWGDWVVWAAGVLLGLSLLGTRRVATLYPRGVWYMRSRDGRRS
jgi:apolipoprotein N-acyltransferase